jgi:hypothetical protein
MPRKKKYSIEIYEPGSRSRVMRELQSDTPLPTISRGDLVSWDGPRKSEKMKEKPLLRVVGIEHVIRTTARGNPVHRIRVFTEEVEIVTEEHETHDATHPKFGETRKIKREQPPVLPPT